MTADEPQRPFVSLGPSDRDPADEHHDAVQLLVLDVLRRFAGTIVDAALKSAQTHELLASEAIMEKAYASRLFGKPELVGAAEAAEILQTTRQRVYQMDREHKRFPAPVVRLHCGPIWLARDIEEFKKTWDRRPGRPRKEKET